VDATVELVCHPRTRTEVVRRIEARVRRTPDGVLGLTFALAGDLARVRVPPPGPPRIAHDLWRHTCFEVFVAVDGAAAYHEIDLAPSGAWGAFAFRGYRDGEPVADEALAPRIAVRAACDRLELDARVPLHRFLSAHARASLRLGLAAVVEDTGGALSYWALHHPAGTPDFHHGDAFRVRLEPPADAC
jgi:hypothetical protein